MNKYTKQLEKAREDAYDAFLSAYRSSYVSAAWSAYYSASRLSSRSAYYSSNCTRDVDNNQLEYQINKVLEVL